MKQQLTPKSLKVGSALFVASSYTDEETHKTEIDLQEWIVRSIKKKRGSQTLRGHAFLVEPSKRDGNTYVNITRKVPYVTTDHKTGKWLSSIPEWCRKSFAITSERLPNGFYTTPEAAFKYLLADLEDELKEAKLPLEKRKHSWCTPEPIEVLEKEIRLVKSRLTKLKNKKKSS